MTVSYTADVATTKLFGIFWRLLFRWRGSIYKQVWPELLLFCFLHYSLRFIYDYALEGLHRTTFEKLALYVQQFANLIPLAFLLGFYTNIVIQRWWDSNQRLPRPTALAILVSASVHGLDDRGRILRRTILRYANLSLVLTLSMISPQVKKRFPTMNHLVETGFMNENEQQIFEEFNTRSPQPKYWMPLVWAGAIVSRARREGRIRDDYAVKTLIDEINSMREKLLDLLKYDTVSIPLVYTQVVSIAVYSYCLSSLFASQFLDPSKRYDRNYIDLYVPWFTILQFSFYMGWLKVAETLLNPFGEDDDDFDTNSIIDKSIQVSYFIVDGMHNEHPALLQDLYWEELIPIIPHTIASQKYNTEPPQGSAADIEVPLDQQKFIPMTVEEEKSEIIEMNDGQPIVEEPKRPELQTSKSSQTCCGCGCCPRFRSPMKSPMKSDDKETDDNIFKASTQFQSVPHKISGDKKATNPKTQSTSFIDENTTPRKLEEVFPNDENK